MSSGQYKQFSLKNISFFISIDPANMPLKASDVFKVLEIDFSIGNDNTSDSNSSIEDSTLEKPYDPGDMFPSEDNNTYTDDLLKQCDKILNEYPPGGQPTDKTAAKNQ